MTQNKKIRFKKKLGILALTALTSYGIITFSGVSFNKIAAHANLNAIKVNEPLKIVVAPKTSFQALANDPKVKAVVANIIKAKSNFVAQDYSIAVKPLTGEHQTTAIGEQPVSARITVTGKGKTSGQFHFDAVVTSAKTLLEQLVVNPITINSVITDVVAFKTKVLQEFNLATKLNLDLKNDVVITKSDAKPLLLSDIYNANTIALTISAKLESFRVTGTKDITVNKQINYDLSKINITDKPQISTTSTNVADLKNNEEIMMIVADALKSNHFQVTEDDYEITTAYNDTTVTTISDGTEVLVTVSAKSNKTALKKTFSFIVTTMTKTNTINAITIDHSEPLLVPPNQPSTFDLSTFIKNDSKVHTLITTAIKTKYNDDDINVEYKKDYDLEVKIDENNANIKVKATSTSNSITGYFTFKIILIYSINSFNILDTTGIPDNTNINDMVKTNNGIYFVATDAGLYYRNTTNKYYQKVEGVSGQILALLITEEDTIYAGNDIGTVFKIKTDKINHIPTIIFTKKINDDGFRVTTLKADKKGNIYAGNNHGQLYTLPASGNGTVDGYFDWLVSTNSSLKSIDVIIDLLITDSNKKYVAIDQKGIYEISSDNKLISLVSGRYFTNFVTDNNGNSYILEKNYGYLYQLKAETWEKIRELPSNHSYSSLAIDNLNNFYVTNDQGIFKIAAGELIKVFDAEKNFSKLAKDETGNLYAIGVNRNELGMTLQKPIAATLGLVDNNVLEAYLKRELLFLFNQYLRLYTDYQIVDHDASRQLIMIRGIGKYHGLMQLKYEKATVANVTFEVEAKVKAQLLGYDPSELLTFQNQKRPQTIGQLKNFTNGQPYEQWLIATAATKFATDIANIEAKINSLANNSAVVKMLLLIFNHQRPQTKAQLLNFDDEGNSYEAWLKQKAQYLGYQS